jgi:fructose-bisphosphate aldolase class II
VPQELAEIIRQYGGDMKETYGVPVEEIVEGIKHGVRKINIDTDIRLAMTGAIRQYGREARRNSIRASSSPTREGRQGDLQARYEAFGCAGQAARSSRSRWRRWPSATRRAN